jgi:adenosine deaminase
LLQVQRIDHGVRAVEDPALMAYLRDSQLPLTVCPLSNVRLCLFERLEDHNLLELLESGLCVTVNSDDPEYFGGYLNDNFVALVDALELSAPQALRLAENSFRASFSSDAEKAAFQAQLRAYAPSG